MSTGELLATLPEKDLKIRIILLVAYTTKTTKGGRCIDESVL